MKSRKERSGLIVVTGIVLLAACSDAPTAPANSARSTPQVAGYSGSTIALGDTLVQVVTVSPWTRTAFNFGPSSANKLVFPVNSICDVVLSSYGADQWDQPCAPQVLPVVITVRSWTDSTGLPRSDFSPHMRFNPAADAVVLTLRDRVGVQGSLGINYCPDVGACFDESLTDPSLVTYRDPNNGNYFRRVKHFSGYNISSGRSVMAE